MVVLFWRQHFFKLLHKVINLVCKNKQTKQNTTSFYVFQGLPLHTCKRYPHPPSSGDLTAVLLWGAVLSYSSCSLWLDYSSKDNISTKPHRPDYPPLRIQSFFFFFLLYILPQTEDDWFGKKIWLVLLCIK